MYYIYILQSQKDNTFYVGISDNPERRLIEHNKGKSKYTSKKLPWIIIYIEQCNNRSEAREREKHLKSYNGVREKRDIISKHSINCM